MPQAFQASLSPPSDAEIMIDGVLSDEEVVTLNRFLDQYEALAESRPMQIGIPCEVSIHVQDGKAEVLTSLPPRDDLDIVFQRLRLFLLHKERTSFDNVRAILKRHLRAELLRQFLKDQQNLFQNGPGTVSSRMVFNNVEISNEAALQNWMYGYQFHGDDTRRAAFESHGIPIDHPSVRRTLIGLLLNKQAAISNIAAITAVIMGRSSQFDLNEAIFRRTTANG
jgi:hypothetical protein